MYIHARYEGTNFCACFCVYKRFRTGETSGRYENSNYNLQLN